MSEAKRSPADATDAEPRPSRDAWFLTGPTASGKSAVAMELAARRNAEILSLDSMAVYRGMDIGTAKPSLTDRQRVPHHLIDLVDPHEEFSLAEYLDAATKAMRDVNSRGKLPLFVGGTPLYLTALLRGVDSGPPPDWEFRQRWQDEAARHGNDFVHAELQRVDPAAAAKLHPGNLRRVIRALETFHLTGRKMSELPNHFDTAVPRQECRVFLLEWPREELNQRINARVDEMFAAGWIDEVYHLVESQSLGRTASQAVGYRQIIEHLRGAMELAETVEKVKTATLRFAKRQRTWFRGMSECRVMEMASDTSPPESAERIASLP